MSKYYYDLHIHSCLSPCADDDMTPNNICGMAALKGLNIIALTDHNTCGNCESFLKVAKANGLIGIAGMELTTTQVLRSETTKGLKKTLGKLITVVIIRSGGVLTGCTCIRFKI